MKTHQLFAVLALSLFSFSRANLAVGQSALPENVMEALHTMHESKTSPNVKVSRAQRALLLMHNDDINRARLLDWVSDDVYQAAQNDYNRINQALAGKAAGEAGGVFSVQKSNSNTFSPGTDSDYIVRVTGDDPVGQIKQMQTRYNELIDDFLTKNLGEEVVQKAKTMPWHNKLDVDFMASPQFVTKEQFLAIAELNNDAYTRRGAAVYEAVSRAKDGTKVMSSEFRDYGLEMRDFINRKQAKLAQYKANPAKKFATPAARADFHRIMAQEAKYIERVEGANLKLRLQEGLPVENLDPVYDLTYDQKGNAVIRKRGETIASRAAKRSPGNFSTTYASSQVAQNSVNNAFRELGESMAEAARKDPTRWTNFADDIAQLGDQLSDAEKMRMLENIKQKVGGEQAKKVASAMRERHKAQSAQRRAAGGSAGRSPGLRTSAAAALEQFDTKIQKALGVSNDFTKMTGARRAFNAKATKALGKLEKLGKLGTAVELATSAAHAKTYVESIQNAMDPSITDAEAEVYFDKAQQAAHGMALAGGAGALFEAVPTLGAIYGGWTLGYDGSRWLLTNTETGQMIDRGATDFFDSHIQEYERVSDELSEYFGGTSQATSREGQLRDMEASYLRALKAGRIKLKPGVSTKDIVARIRAGDIYGLDDLLEAVSDLGPEAAGYNEYLVWYNDLKWIHIGTVGQFKQQRLRGDEIWGGSSKEPLTKETMLGGKHFETREDAFAALVELTDGKLTRKRHPLAFPKVVAMFGDLRLDPAIVNDPLFRRLRAQ